MFTRVLAALALGTAVGAASEVAGRWDRGAGDVHLHQMGREARRVHADRGTKSTPRTPHPHAGAARGVEVGQNRQTSPRETSGRRYVRVWVYRTWYCSRGGSCTNRICGTNALTANGTDATKEGGFAADPRWCPYGTRLRIAGRVYVADDCFGKAQRARDRVAGRRHIDIRVAGKTHAQVSRMGAGYIQVEIIP